MRKVWGALAIALALALGGSAQAAEARRGPGPTDAREVDAAVRLGKLPVEARPGSAQPALEPSVRARAVGETPAVGTEKTWLALNDVDGFLYAKPYTLRALGDHIEVWVANDLSFPAGDCRNDSVAITDEQAQYLAGQFDTNMYPKESAAFSVPQPRDGSNPALTELPDGNGGTVPVPAGYWGGQGEDIVALIDNVVDDNYFDTNWQRNTTYIAGFFAPSYARLLDRNVMTIDAWDWLHRTGANPPNEPDAANQCANHPARPFLYEGTFAHEYQHLLENDEDPDEVSWVNEGLSDWAMTLTGYLNPSLPITDQAFSSHVQCFLGNLGIRTPANPNPRDGGPENSLTLWGDQGDDEILCDYGAAYTMMEMLAGRYGQAFMTALHRDDANGFAGLAAVLAAAGRTESVPSVVRDWLATAALDGVLDRGASLSGRAASLLQTPTLDAAVNWDTPETYSTPGAPPNGADFVRLRDAQGRYLRANDLRGLRFTGAPALEPAPVEWVVDPNPEGQAGDAALHSGSGSNFDRSLVRAIDVPAADPTLTFATRWNTEEGWDFGFVQVSTDGGKTWTSLGNADTTTEHDPGAIELAAANVPGFTGDSGGWRSESFDLSAYAGQSVLLAFRYVTDPGVDLPGWWIDDVAVGGTVLSDGSSLDGWQTMTQVNPVPVAGYTVQLVGYTSKTLTDPSRGGRNVAFAHELPLRNGRTLVMTRAALRRLLGSDGRRADVVAVLVTQNDPGEQVPQYARYTLRTGGVVQPGG